MSELEMERLQASGQPVRGPKDEEARGAGRSERSPRAAGAGELQLSYGRDMITVSRKTVADMEENARKMGEMILQLGTMIGAMQRRMDEMEARQARVTISHGDVKRIQGLIRYRADEICRKYNLQDPKSQQIFRAAIRKDVLKRYQVKDLHDVPESAMAGVDGMVNSWTNIRLVMETREKVKA